ncbi:MAG: AraC family transcriptional regulator [Gordonia sp. (in: high G+C Gram-positive bacteria)]
MTHPPGHAVLPIEGGWDQLLYTAAGTMRVSTAAGAWTVPPSRALWLPGDTPATITSRFRVVVRTLYIAADLRALPPIARMVDMSDLVRELVLHAVRACPLDIDEPRDHALLTVLFDQLRALPDGGLWLPSPTSTPAARAAAELIGRHPAMSLADVADAVATSRRTLERVFRADTGFGLGAWRRRSRLLTSLEYLAAGRSVTETATALGYSAPSAFVVAFTREFGHTPRTFMQR